MSESWCQEYVLLAFRIEKVFSLLTDLPFIDVYYGPPEWKHLVEHEPEMETADLVRSAMTLADRLSVQEFDSQRCLYLEKQVGALEMICRLLDGQTFSLEEQIQRCLDITPSWIPESHFEEALGWYAEALPGQKRLMKRLARWKKPYQLSQRHLDKLPSLIEQIAAEIRQRTSSLVKLPPGEVVEIQLVNEKPFGAAHYYLGNYRSRIEINCDALAHWTLRELVDTLCHEGYPGHHVYAVLQDQMVYRKYGYVEQAIPLLLTPQCLIGEGIAMLACEMLFAPTELETWLEQHLYPELEIEGEWADLDKLRQAEDVLQGVWCNAAFLLHEGRSEQEVSNYLGSYGQTGSLQLLKDPFGRIYAFSYVYGRSLLREWFEGTHREKAFQSLLTQQIVPSALMKVLQE